MANIEIPRESLSFRLFFRLICWFGRLLLVFLGPVRVLHRSRIPKTGGVLILANHQSDVDPVVVQAACPRHIVFMAKSELFEMRGLGRIIRWFGAFPVRRGEPDRQAIKFAVEVLKSGRVLCVFPEGRLSETGALMDLQPGVSLIARMAGVPVVCCGLKGTRKIIPYGSCMPRPAFGGVKVEWGEPFDWPETDGLDRVRAEIEALRA